MSGKLWLAGGLAAGYVLGTKAGRERYEQLLGAMNKVKTDPAVQNAIETVQNQAGRIYSSGRTAVNEKLEHSRQEREHADLEADLVTAPRSTL